MRDLTYIFMWCIILVAGLGTIAIWAPRRFAIKLLAIGIVALTMSSAYVAMANLLSYPKPISLEWYGGKVEEASVISAFVQEGQAIYVWLRLSDATEPRAFALPWNRDMAEQLQKARQEANEQGGGLSLKMPFEKSWDKREPKFYALPQPVLPPKDITEPPRTFQRPDQDA